MMRVLMLSTAREEVRTFPLADFQESAVRRAREILASRGGVLIADSVGMGKTFVALALIESALSEGAACVLVVSPAGLRSHWTPHLRRLARAHAVPFFGRGARAAAQGPPSRPSGNGGPVLGWASIAMIALGRWTAALEAPQLLVVDEAHAFRNPLTRRYRHLAWLARSARVVLLSATPVNNSLLDLYHLLRLFLGHGDLEDMGVPDLRAALRAASRSPDGRLPAPLDAAIAAVMVRRTRHLLLSREPALAARFPRRASPKAVLYDMDVVAPRFFERAGELVHDLRLAAFDGDALHVTTAALLRCVLLKRLESSVAALHATAQSLERYLGAFSEALAAGYRLRATDHRALTSRGEGQLVFLPLALPPASARVDRTALLASAAADCMVLQRLRALVRPALLQDPKLCALRELLRTELAGRKTLVFTEYRETATHLWQSLRGEFRVALVHGGGARMGGLRAGRRETIELFSPAASGRRAPRESERIDVLIATDVLAEGFNLQDASDVVSYDLPWNPVRLIQRAGRIDRLGSPHARICCHSFLPGAGLEPLLGLVERLNTKLSAIRAGVGVEARVLPALAAGESGRRATGRRGARRDSAPPSRAAGAQANAGTHSAQSFIAPEEGAGAPAPALAARVIRRLAAGDATLFDDLEEQEDCVLAIEERLRVAYQRSQRERESQIRAGHPDDVLEVALLTGPGDGQPCCVAAVEVRGRLRWCLVSANQEVTEDRTSAFGLLLRGLEAGPRAAPDAAMPDALLAAAAMRAAQAVVRFSAAWSRPAAAAAGRVRWVLRTRVLRSLAVEPGGADAALCARAERVLAALAAGGRAGTDIALAELLRRPGPRAADGARGPQRTADSLRGPPRAALRPGSTALLLDGMEAALGAGRGAAGRPPPGAASGSETRSTSGQPAVPRITGILVVARPP